METLAENLDWMRERIQAAARRSGRQPEAIRLVAATKTVEVDRILSVGNTPYWATDGPGGDQCWMSVAADNKVAVLDYATKSVITYVPVGNHPQRVRAGVIQNSLIG